MDPKFRSSFIPQKPIVTKSSVRKKYRSYNVLTFVSTVLFVISLVAAIGAFAYERFIEASLDQKGIELGKARQSINSELITEFKALDEKLRTAEELLNRHTAMTLFFDFLESSTLQNVQYNDFSYLLDSLGGITINMKGIAQSFNSVTLQSDIFKNSGVMLDPKFSNLNLDESGNIEFSVTSKINPSFILYRNAFNANEDLKSF